MKIDFHLKEELRKYLEKKIKEERRVAKVISSYPLTEDEINQLKKGISELAKREVVNIVDKSIIGGLIIKFDSQEIDLSILGQLKKFKNLLVE